MISLESPLDSKEIKPVNTKGNQCWIFIGMTNVEAEASIIWLPDAKSQLTGKDPDAGKECEKEKKGATEYEMVGWRHWLNRHEFEETPGDGGGKPGMLQTMGLQSLTKLSNWTTSYFSCPGPETRHLNKDNFKCFKPPCNLMRPQVRTALLSPVKSQMVKDSNLTF